VALVNLAPVQLGAISGTATLYGAVEQGAANTWTLAAPAEAQVARLGAPEGSAVRQGQLVVLLRASPATSADMARSRADAESSRQAYARAQRLRADGLASDADVEAARAAAQSASAQASGQSAIAGDLALRAPGPGYVETIAVNPGDRIASGTTVATIARAGDWRARFGIAPETLRKLGSVRSLSISLSSSDRPISVPVVSIDPTADPQTRLASIWTLVPQGSGLAAGEALRAQVRLAAAGNMPTIPYAALLDDGGQPYVYVVNKNVAQRRDVETGPTQSDRVAVTKGLKAGEMVVIAGGTALEDGMKVRTK